MIFDRLEQFQNKIALVNDEGDSLNFYDLAGKADKMAENLESRRLIFILCSNHLSAIIGYVGVLRKRAVPLLLRADIQDDLLENLLNIYKPRYIWANKNRSFKNFNLIYTDDKFRLWQTDFQENFPLHENLAVLLSTSGSVGSPKLVRQSYENIQANTESIIKYLQLDSSDRAITTMPMYYTYGLSIIQTQLHCGGSLAVTDATIFQRKFWDFVKSQKVTNFGGVPYFYEMLKRLRFANMNLPSLRFITQAGGKLASELTAEFVDICAKKNIKFITMYGACEATARMSYLPYQYAKDKVGSIGIAIPNGKFSILTEDGEETTAPNVTGELIYYGKNVSLGYAERGEDLIKGDENHDKLNTGDIAYCDEDGYFYIVGRKKRFLKIFGNRVSLDAVESFLKAQGYFECACSGVDDKLKVYIATPADAGKLKDLLSQFTHLHASAFSVVNVKEIPRNESGKILYAKLEEYKKV